MLERLGCRDLEQLLQECVPAEILIDADHARDALPQECDERQALRELEQRAAANTCLLYTSPSPRDYAASRMPSSA